MKLLGRFVRGEKGQDLVEYALLASLVSTVSVLGLWMLGSKVKNLVNMIYLLWPRGT